MLAYKTSHMPLGYVHDFLQKMIRTKLKHFVFRPLQAVDQMLCPRRSDRHVMPFLYITAISAALPLEA